jgi:DENN (AEX-3) domain
MAWFRIPFYYYANETMTKANGDRVHVCCITIWYPLSSNVAADLESQCTEWREGNLSLEERELAESLSSKLANERTILSSLLHQLSLANGHERGIIDEQILHCEEKISLYNDLLRPVRLHAAAKVEGLTEGQGMWLPRCYGILGREEGFMTVWREWLRAIAIPWVSDEVDVDILSPQGATFLPLERYVVNLCGEVPVPIQGKNQIEIAVRELRYASYYVY